MNNSVYGKTMENIRKYQDVKLMKLNDERDEKAFRKKVSSPRFKYGRPIGDTLVDAYMEKASVTLNKPIVVEASVLVETKDIYKDMAEHPDIFDLNNTKTIRLFKDETPEGYGRNGNKHIYAKLRRVPLNDPIDKSSLSEQKAMRANADPMTLVYQDCLFDKEVFHAKNKEGIKIYGDFVLFCKDPDNSDSEVESSKSDSTELRKRVKKLEQTVDWIGTYVEKQTGLESGKELTDSSKSSLSEEAYTIEEPRESNSDNIPPIIIKRKIHNENKKS
ncbi:hypothetical protein RclHR1_34590001, partial [Rhizophagus clarus]